MNKLKVKKDIKNIYNDCIDHKGLAAAYKTGMKLFIDRIVNYIKHSDL